MTPMTITSTLVAISQHSAGSSDYASEYEYEPAPGADVVPETETLGVEQRLYGHCQADVEYTYAQGQHHLEGVA